MVGTLRWAEQTHGRLRARDRFELQAQIARLLLERVPRSLRRRIGTSEKLQADLERIRPPETPIAQAAAALCAEASSEAITNHAFRTYLSARLPRFATACATTTSCSTSRRCCTISA